MRAIAACQFTLCRFDAWRWGVAAFAFCGAAAIWVWFLSLPAGWGGWVAVALGGVTLVLLALAASLLRTSAVSLRWDGLVWQLAPAESAADGSMAGDVSVAMDLGNWMLLEFRADSGGRGRRVTWLPVQRGGMETHWHSLRCAVYSPRPAAGSAQTAGPAADF
ncbi:MAG: hypothetical protein AD742_15040 [Methylibium sp. NZG]|nr:MAG: hypothetical protein AD742_15040 [Methylibium sp. NZG]